MALNTAYAVGRTAFLLPTLPLKMVYVTGYLGYHGLKYAFGTTAVDEQLEGVAEKVEEVTGQALEAVKEKAIKYLDVNEEDGDWTIMDPTASEYLERGSTTAEAIDLKERILQTADTIFVPRLEQSAVYSTEQLTGTQAEMPTQRKPVFMMFSNMLKLISGARADQTVSEEIIESYLGASQNPQEHFIEQLEANNPAALQVAAVFAHFQAPLTYFVETPVNPDESLKEMQIALHTENSHIEFFAKDKDGAITFAIKGDEVALTTANGNVLGGYFSTRYVMIGYPKDGSVECRVMTMYDRIIDQTHAE